MLSFLLLNCLTTNTPKESNKMQIDLNHIDSVYYIGYDYYKHEVPFDELKIYLIKVHNKLKNYIHEIFLTNWNSYNHKNSSQFKPEHEEEYYKDLYYDVLKNTLNMIKKDLKLKKTPETYISFNRENCDYFKDLYGYYEHVYSSKSRFGRILANVEKGSFSRKKKKTKDSRYNEEFFSNIRKIIELYIFLYSECNCKTYLNNVLKFSKIELEGFTRMNYRSKIKNIDCKCDQRNNWITRSHDSLLYELKKINRKIKGETISCQGYKNYVEPKVISKKRHSIKDNAKNSFLRAIWGEKRLDDHFDTFHYLHQKHKNSYYILPPSKGNDLRTRIVTRRSLEEQEIAMSLKNNERSIVVLDVFIELLFIDLFFTRIIGETIHISEYDVIYHMSYNVAMQMNHDYSISQMEYDNCLKEEIKSRIMLDKIDKNKQQEFTGDNEEEFDTDSENNEQELNDANINEVQEKNDTNEYSEIYDDITDQYVNELYNGHQHVNDANNDQQDVHEANNDQDLNCHNEEKDVNEYQEFYDADIDKLQKLKKSFINNKNKFNSLDSKTVNSLDTSHINKVEEFDISDETKQKEYDSVSLCLQDDILDTPEKMNNKKRLKKTYSVNRLNIDDFIKDGNSEEYLKQGEVKRDLKNKEVDTKNVLNPKSRNFLIEKLKLLAAKNPKNYVLNWVVSADLEREESEEDDFYAINSIEEDCDTKKIPDDNFENNYMDDNSDNITKNMRKDLRNKSKGNISQSTNSLEEEKFESKLADAVIEKLSMEIEGAMPKVSSMKHFTPLVSACTTMDKKKGTKKKQQYDPLTHLNTRYTLLFEKYLANIFESDGEIHDLENYHCRFLEIIGFFIKLLQKEEFKDDCFIFIKRILDKNTKHDKVFLKNAINALGFKDYNDKFPFDDFYKMYIFSIDWFYYAVEYLVKQRTYGPEKFSIVQVEDWDMDKLDYKVILEKMSPIKRKK